MQPRRGQPLAPLGGRTFDFPSPSSPPRGGGPEKTARSIEWSRRSQPRVGWRLRRSTLRGNSRMVRRTIHGKPAEYVGLPGRCQAPSVQSVDACLNNDLRRVRLTVGRVGLPSQQCLLVACEGVPVNIVDTALAAALATRTGLGRRRRKRSSLPIALTPTCRHFSRVTRARPHPENAA